MLAIYLSILETSEDRNKFEQLYLKYRLVMLHTAMTTLHNMTEAEDAVHDAFLKVIRVIDKIDEVNCGKTKGLLVIITRHTALDMVKSKERSAKVDLDDMEPFLKDDAPLPLEQIVSQRGYEKLLQCIGKLCSTYKTVCQLRFIYEYDEKSISKLLSLTPKVVNMRIFRGRQVLKKMLMEEMENHEPAP